jgi:hypothetical protein
MTVGFWEDTATGRDGRPMRILRTDAPAGAVRTCDRLTDEQLSYWQRNLARRPLYFESDLLRTECHRRGLSVDPGDEIGQRLLFPE